MNNERQMRVAEAIYLAAHSDADGNPSGGHTLNSLYEFWPRDPEVVARYLHLARAAIAADDAHLGCHEHCHHHGFSAENTGGFCAACAEELLGDYEGQI
jgi:hypothetical protein